ncbi:MAG: type II secretion system F family protein [Armatimonadetes bacterium]|nr:type II secretion system F family protein [Armatimonadota bacterium]
MTPQVVVLAAVFFGSLGAVLVAQHYATRAQRAVGRRMRVVVEGAPESGIAPRASAAGVYLPGVAAHFRRTPYFQHVGDKLGAAGVPLRAVEFVALCGMLAAATFVSVVFLTHRVPPAALWAAGGFAAPHFVLNMVAERRRQMLETQLSDTLIMVSSAMQAGFGFLQGIQMAADQMPQPIAPELQRVVRLVQLGMPLEQALNQMGARVQSYDFDLMIASTNTQLAMGGNLIRLYRTITETIQERLRIRGEIKATTAEGRLSAMVLILLPVGMLGILMLMKPDYAQTMLFTPTGQALLKMAGGLQLVGVLVIRKILNLDL